MQKSLLMIVALLASLTLAAPAWAGCVADTTVNSYQVETTPPTDCLGITVEGNECVGYVTVFLENSCEASFAPDSDEWVCTGSNACDYSEDGSRTVTAIPSGNTGRYYVLDFASNTDETRNFSGALDAQAVDIEVQFNASEDSSPYDGCNQTGATPSAGWLAAALGLLALGASSRRHMA